MNAPFKWNCFCLIPILSNVVYYCFRSENVTCERPLHVSDKMTTIPREYLPQMENKHQIMNVHTKWNCLIPILSSLVKY